MRRIPLPVAAIAGLALMGQAEAAPAKPKPGAPPPAVVVAPVTVKNVAPTYSEIGRVLAIQAVKIVPRVTAFIEQVPVRQGSIVKAGQVLFLLQKSQYEASLQSAEASLASAQAALQNAQLAYGRAARLSHQGFEAQSNLDAALATRNQDQASVQSAKANIIQAGLNLSYCTITSPIDGRVGAVTLTKGNLVTPSSGTLLTVNQMNPIRVVFSVADRILVSALEKAQGAHQTIFSGLKVTLALPNGKTYPETGKLAFLDNQVDPQTGTVSIYADFPNPQALLLPGSFVTVNITQAKPQDKPLVPVAAVQTDKSGKFVLLVGPDNKVKQQSVSVGAQIAQNYIVDNGLNPGQHVIVEGSQKVKAGQTVNPSVTSGNPSTSGATGGSSGSSDSSGQD